MPDRYFNRNEAQELLPVITRELEQVRRRKQTIDQLEHELAQAAARIMMVGGSIPNHEELTKKRAESLRLTAQLKQAIDRIQETGCVVKDLDEGLVDFPSLLDGQEVYLCRPQTSGQIHPGRRESPRPSPLILDFRSRILDRDGGCEWLLLAVPTAEH